MRPAFFTASRLRAADTWPSSAFADMAEAETEEAVEAAVDTGSTWWLDATAAAERKQTGALSLYSDDEHAL